MWREYNANPVAKRANDCTVRAIATAMNLRWEEVYLNLCITGLKMHDMPSSNSVWSAYLIQEGYRRYVIPNTCPNCYTVRQFARDHAEGTYIVALHGHVLACIDGEYFDTWDSGDEIPMFYFRKEKR